VFNRNTADKETVVVKLEF